VALAVSAWHAKVMPNRVDHWSQEEKEQIFRDLLKNPHQTGFEYVNLVFVIENCSRAFQSQLIRHRIGFSYSIQSLREVSCESFATRGAYTLPPSVKDKEFYHEVMLDLQAAYTMMINDDEHPESIGDARGILPLNIHSPITFACTYRALLAMLKQRFCVASREEGEWVEVAEQMRAAIIMMEPIMAEPFDCLCGRFKNGNGFCRTKNKAVTTEG
jgi:thymidylate synthase (FAD)